MKLAEMLAHEAQLIRELRRNELEHALSAGPVQRLNFACRRALRKHDVQLLCSGVVVFDQAAVMRRATWWWERLERIAARRAAKS